MEPRGIRNNNPLNIRLSNDRWQGQRPPSNSPGGEKVFCEFSEMKYGWRAAFRLLCNTYYKKYGLKTISDIIYRWAPPKENNTAAYIRRVSDYISIGPDRELGDPATHPTQWMMLGIAMAVVECGTANQDYLSMLKGFELAVSG